MTYISGLNFVDISDTFFFCNRTVSQIMKNDSVIEEIMQKDMPLIYTKTDYIEPVFNILNELNKECDVITHHSDKNVDKDLYQRKPKNVNRWFSQNVNYIAPDLIPIPIGFSDSYTLATKYHELEPFVEEEKNNFVYVNFRPETYNTRKKIHKLLSKNKKLSVVNAKKRGDNLDYIRELSTHKYCVCPRGNGLDTHRVWEALFVGSIPIVEDCVMYRKMKEIEPSIPFVFTKKYSDIDWDELENNYKKPNINSSVFDVNFWVNLENE